MKKVLFLCDGENFSNGAFQFIKQLNVSERVFVKGMFFDEIDYDQIIALSHI